MGGSLVSGDKRAEPVLAYSPTGQYMDNNKSDNPSASLLSEYRRQIDMVVTRDDLPVSVSWTEVTHPDNTKELISLTVNPLIKVRWNQGAGWNQFCPADINGPGGKVYVGCVAVAMAQAMSVYKYPAMGAGIHSYEAGIYGTLEVNYDNAVYNWDEMSATTYDSKNALLLYHCAVSVSMDFGPTGSSASTSQTPEALRTHFSYSKRMVYRRSVSYSAENWIGMLKDELALGRPVIYRGEDIDGISAHSFNIDGVNSRDLFHLNWGWSGSYDGYYLLSALSPGNRDYSFNHGAVFNFQPYYYPTDLTLSNNIVPEDEEAGAIVGEIEVVDEALDNEYTIELVTDSTYIGDNWVMDYFIEGNILKTGRQFSSGGIDKDTVWFTVYDKVGNILEVETELLFQSALDKKEITHYNFASLKIYPNPSEEVVYLSLVPGFIPSAITIFSFTGEKVLTISNFSEGNPVDISSLTSGIYIMEITATDGMIARKKLIKN
ncbi:MAG: C10 family peptidase [Bacteroidales bacterium]